jgi:hypothetical protein
MDFVVSSESDSVVHQNLASVDSLVEPELNSRLSGSPRLAPLKLQIRYVPIVMPDEMAKWYPERSSANVRRQIIDCAPHLSYSIFAGGDKKEMMKEYIRGIRLAVDFMPSFSLSSEDISEFNDMLNDLECSFAQ